ncbi:MAG: Rossmann-like domain-containing protein [Betaproteobacteria bacterium]
MTVAHETLDLLGRALAGRAVPRVRALHLPRAPWDGSKDGEFGALELDDGSLGLSYVLLDGALAALVEGSHGPALVGTDALAVARGWAEGAGARRTLGFAAVNALTRHLFDRAGYAPPDAADSIGGLDPQPGEHIGMVGFFPPLVKQVTARGARLTVLELKSELAGDRGEFTITLDPAALESCDKVLSTSTVLLNDTLDDVLARCAHARAFAMIGPGASCLPDALFARGVTLLGGVWIEDAGAFKQALAAGQPWGRHARKFALARSGYPGLQALLSNLRERGGG